MFEAALAKGVVLKKFYKELGGDISFANIKEQVVKTGLKNRKIKVMNAELKKVVDRMKTVQSQLQTMLKDSGWVENAREYAEKQGKEVKKLLTSDMGKMKSFLERERKELEKLQKQIPGEVKKLQKFVKVQKKELEKLLTSVRKASGKTSAKKTTGAPRRKSAAKKSSGASAQA